MDDNDVVVGTGVIHLLAIRNAAQFDIGLLHTGTHWADFGVDRSDVARMAFSSTRKGATTTALAPGDSFLAFGFGTNGDLSTGDMLRFDRDPVDVDAVTNSPETGVLLRNDADRVRMCDGDSGSPAYLHAANGLPITAGVLATGSPDASCSPAGTKQFWPMLQTSADFIESTLEQTFGRTCTPADLAISSDVSMQVLDCL